MRWTPMTITCHRRVGRRVLSYRCEYRSVLLMGIAGIVWVTIWCAHTQRERYIDIYFYTVMDKVEWSFIFNVICAAITPPQQQNMCKIRRRKACLWKRARLRCLQGGNLGGLLFGFVEIGLCEVRCGSGRVVVGVLGWQLFVVGYRKWTPPGGFGF